MSHNIVKIKILCYNWYMVYTIGYAGATVERFINVLKKKNVTILIDVRSLAKSKYFNMFNDNNLSNSLKKVGIIYENWSVEFGARQNDMNYFTQNILDYSKFANSKQFIKGLQKIENLLNCGHNICLMCAEIDPINCHRAILCAKEIAKKCNNIEHIILKRNGETLFETQFEFEQRLKECLKVNNLEEAYRKQNIKIGYKLT